MLRSALLIAGDHRLDEADEVGERAVAVGGVALEREVGTIELQQEAGGDDRLVFDLQRGAERIEIALERVIVLVLHDRRDDAGRRRGEKRLDMAALHRLQRGAEVGAFGLDRRAVRVGDLADRLRQLRTVRHPVGRGDARLEFTLVLRIVVEIGMHRARALAAEPGQAVAHVEHEGFARLLAVVDHVEAGVDLLLHDRAHRGAALALDLGRIDRLAAHPLREQSRQRGGTRQAAGMGGQDTLFAALHRSSEPAIHCQCALAARVSTL